MQKISITLPCLLLTAALALAAPRFGTDSPSFSDYLGGTTRGASLGLIDPSRITFDHSLQMGVMGFSGGSLVQSLYSSTAHYRVSDPVSLSFTLGLMGTRYNGSSAPALSQDFIGGVALDYRPTNNMHFRVEVARAPYYYGLNRYTGSNSFFGNRGPLSAESETPR